MISVRPDVPPAVLWIARTLEDAGFETWAVGGAIRDALIGQGSSDWDLATRARPPEVRRLFRRTVPIGVEHGTVGVLARDGVMYEVTTFRKDIETDGRHAVVEFADDLESDLARRDFTVNAIAWHPIREAFFDPFGGADDLEQRILRTVGVAHDRFREDYLRILRAIRFAGRFDLEVEETTWGAMRELAGFLTSLSPERVRDELLKILDTDPTPERGLDLYRRSGALGVLYPELHQGLDAPGGAAAWDLTLAAVGRLPVGRPHLRLAALLRGLEAEKSVALLVRLRLSNAVTDEVAHLAASSPLPGPGEESVAVRRWLHRHGVERVTPVARMDLAAARARAADPVESVPGRDEVWPNPETVVMAWRRARAIRRIRPPVTVGDLNIDGRGLKRLGLKPGPAFGAILDALLGDVLVDPERNVPEWLETRAAEIASAMSDDD